MTFPGERVLFTYYRFIFIFKYHFLIQNSKYNNLLFLVQEMDSGIPQCPKGTLTKELELI